MPFSRRLVQVSTAIGATASLGLAAGCSSPHDGQPKAEQATQRQSTSAGVEAPPTPTPNRSAPASKPTVPSGVKRVARAFTTAYAQHDARDGKDGAYADAGARAAKFATGELVDVLAQKRPSQDGPWVKLRAEQARQTVEIASAVVPDGAPAVSKSSALVRVGYTLTTNPKRGPSRHSDEQLALRLEHAADGWRVAALPWA